jgi:hypothetical protein
MSHLGSGESSNHLVLQSKNPKQEIPIMVSSSKIDKNQPANERAVEIKADGESQFRDAGEQA